jgi:hypothetical protein
LADGSHDLRELILLRPFKGPDLECRFFGYHPALTG